MLPHTLIVFLAFACAVCHGIPQATPKPPNFGTRYHAKGRVKLPYAELDEPFKIYFDGAKKIGRLDFYDGMDKAFYYTDTKNYTYGALFNDVPVVASKNTTKSTRMCFLASEGDNKTALLPQSMLPDLKGFQYTGIKKIHGQVLDEWMMITNAKEAKVNKYTFYVSRGSPVVPVQYEMMGFDSLIGSHYDKYVIKYTMFDNKFNDTVFKLPKECQSSSQVGIESRIRANPYQELINPELGDRYEQMFTEYKAKHGKQYADNTEHNERKVQFMHNVRLIHGHNRQGLSFTLGVNHLTDHFDDELRMMRGRRPSKKGIPNGGEPFSEQEFAVKDLPPFIDWRLKGAVSQVKDQAICGSCWSFGAAETIEGAYFLKNNIMVRLSQQNLMDCSWAYGNYGCDGGEEFQAYQWIIDNRGLMSEEDYGHYLGQNGMCHFNASKVKVQLKSYVNVTSGNATALKMALVNVGPVAVGIDAHLKTFSFYASGVYYDKNCSSSQLDHAVLAVGYGSITDGKKTRNYWIIKNSWSTYWGNNGYVLMDMKDNNCGVTTAATYVNIF